MFREKIRFAVLIVLGLSTLSSYARTIDVSVRIRNDSSDEKVINRENLTSIKQLIIKNGLRETYGQMYNNNPAYHTNRFAFYLNPDTGQANINCELDKSDFQTLVMRDPKRKSQYCHIEFINKNEINIRIPWVTEDLTILQIREFASEGIQEILAEILKDTPAIRPQHEISANVKNIQDAIDLAIHALYKEPRLHSTDYVLTSAQQILRNNKWIWRITFKPKELLPDDPSNGPYTLGGEVFVNVDLSTKETVVTYGE